MADGAGSCYTLLIMKPGMQRELLIAFRWLFEEFVLDDEPSAAKAVADPPAPPAAPPPAGPPDKAE
jgi:hypothetical protein